VLKSRDSGDKVGGWVGLE